MEQGPGAELGTAVTPAGTPGSRHSRAPRTPTRRGLSQHGHGRAGAAPTSPGRCGATRVPAGPAPAGVRHIPAGRGHPRGSPSVPAGDKEQYWVSLSPCPGCVQDNSCPRSPRSPRSGAGRAPVPAEPCRDSLGCPRAAAGTPAPAPRGDGAELRPGLLGVSEHLGVLLPREDTQPRAGPLSAPARLVKAITISPLLCPRTGLVRVCSIHSRAVPQHRVILGWC